MAILDDTPDDKSSPEASPDRLEVLYEDNHLLAVFKPAGMLSQGDWTGEASALEAAAEYVKRKYDKPGKAFMGLVHRLDRPTRGVLVFARTSKAAGRLSAQFRERTVRKIYRAWVEGAPEAEGRWEDALVAEKDRSRVVGEGASGSQRAALGFRTLRREAQRTLVEVELETGRKHQIRAQFAHRGHPVVGDRKYGAQQSFDDGGLALLAHCIEFDHPTLPKRLTVTAPPQPEFEP